jgi:hypothetical protein
LFVVTRVIGLGDMAASRYCWMCLAIFWMGCMIEKLRSPRPREPASAALPSDVAAIQQGGCGSCTGLGVTMRRGKSRYLPWNSKYSLSHMPTTAWIASWAISLDASRSTPNAVCSIGVDRPVPHSTRPPLRMSAVATFSATRIGGVKAWGMRVTPKPRRMFSVIWLSAPMMTSGAGEWLRPSRKWCSTCQVVWKPSLSASLICSSVSLYARCSAMRWPYGWGPSFQGLGTSIS